MVVPNRGLVRGLYSEVPVGAENNLPAAGVISCDKIQTISPSDLGEHIGWLLPSQEKALAEAISHAFDLDLL